MRRYIKKLGQLSFLEAIQTIKLSILLKVQKFVNTQIGYIPLHIKEISKVYCYLNKKKGEISNLTKGNILSLTNPDLKIYLRRNSSDFAVFHQIFVEEEYKVFFDLILNQFPNVTVNCIIDAGANIGCTTLLFNLKFPQAQIFSIEPELSNYNSLEKNLQLNGIKNAYAINKGLWTNNRKLVGNRNFRQKREWAYALLEPQESDDIKKEELIECITVEHIIKCYNLSSIDILKMDIEGGEKAFFKDFNTAYSIVKDIKFIAVEVHPECISEKKVMEILVKCGFVINKKHETIYGYNELLPKIKTGC